MSKKYFEDDFLANIRLRACSGMFSDFTNGQIGVKIWTDFQSASDLNIFGPIRTVELKSLATDDENLAVGLPFLTSMRSGEVMLVKGSPDFAYFGELMANLAVRKGLAGTIIFGASRDSRAIDKLNYPLLAQSFTPVDIKGRGRVEAVDSIFLVDGFEIRPGMWVFADSDGLILFSDKDAEAILIGVTQMINHERVILSQIADGLSGEQLAEIHKGF